MEALAEGSGLIEISGGIREDVGRLGASVEHRVSSAVSLFANADIDTDRNWSALGGLRMRW